MGGILNAIAAGPQPTTPIPSQDQVVLQKMKLAEGQQSLQEQQQSLQQNAMALEQTRRTLQSQTAVMQAFQAANGDPDKASQLAAQNGALPADVINLRNLGIKQRTDIANLDDKTLQNHTRHTDIAQGALNSVLQLPEDQAAAQWPKTIQGMIDDGNLTQAQLTQSGLDPQTYPGHERAGIFLAGLNGYGKYLESEQAKREQQTFESNLPKLQAESAQAVSKKAAEDLGIVTDQDSYDKWAADHKQVASVLGPTYDPGKVKLFQRSVIPPEKQPEFDLAQAKLGAQQAMLKQSPAQLQASVAAVIPPNDPMFQSTLDRMTRMAALGDAEGMGKILQDAYDQRGRVQVAKETKANQINLDMGSVNNNAQADATAKGIANYQIAPLSGFAMRSPAGIALMGKVLQENPDFHGEYYNTFQKTENDATTGKIGTSANALNTMMGHLQVLDTAADALKNNDVQAINRIANFLGAQVGQTPKTTYDTIVHRIGPEVTKAYLASGGSVGERGTNEQDFSSNLGPDQIKQNIGVSALLADSKIKALQDQYQRGTYGRGKQNLITPEAEAARQKLAGRASGLSSGGHKAGDTRVIGGITYTRDDKGAWNPQ